MFWNEKIWDMNQVLLSGGGISFLIKKWNYYDAPVIHLASRTKKLWEWLRQTLLKEQNWWLRMVLLRADLLALQNWEFSLSGQRGGFVLLFLFFSWEHSDLLLW